jgi:hypothetical protein
LRAVGLLDQRKTSCFVEAPRRYIALERPELQALEGVFRDLQ